MNSLPDKKTRPKRAAVVGLGWWGQHIIRQTAGSDILHVVRAVGSRDEHRPNGEKYRIDFTTEFVGTRADQSIDFVILAAPHVQHVPQIEEAARAGKHVFCEKPVALSMDGIRECSTLAGPLASAH